MAQKKMKSLLPTLKEKKRYIKFEIKSKTCLKAAEAAKITLDACLKFLGELGVSKAGIMFMDNLWNERKQQGVLRVAHNHVDNVKAALTFIKTINGSEAMVRTIRVSGMINKL